jgi:uncharacterized protein (TIGR02186 family)
MRHRLAALALVAALLSAGPECAPAHAQSAAPSQPTATKRGVQSPPPAPGEAVRPQRPPRPAAVTPKSDDVRPTELGIETVQADVSTRTVAVTSSFTGTEIVVFGAVDNSRQPGPESGYYDVVVVIEGAPSKIAVRKKSRVGGIWLNTRNAEFDGVPSYYAIWSTRPLEEIASEGTMIGYEIGFEHVRMTPAGGTEAAGSQAKVPAVDATDFRAALVRLKARQGLYVRNEFGVTFIGKSLFRANIALPANVTVGPFETRVYLFHDEKLLSQYSARLNLEREGVERHLHDFAFSWPLIYGIATVLIAAAAGLAAATMSGKSLR